MALHSKKLSFTRPIMLSFAGILCSFALIAVVVTLSQRKDFLEDYHKINGNFTHNLAVNYTESILRENDYILGRSAMYFARDDRLNETLNVNPTQGLQMMMHLQNLMPDRVIHLGWQTRGDIICARRKCSRRKRVKPSIPGRVRGLSPMLKPVYSATTPVPIWTISTVIRRSHSINR